MKLLSENAFNLEKSKNVSFGNELWKENGLWDKNMAEDTENVYKQDVFGKHKYPRNSHFFENFDLHI